MKRNIGLLIILIFLSQLLPLPLPGPEARAETRVTITVAAGGVACGVYFFLRFAFRSSMTTRQQEEAFALVNYGPTGWRIGPPALNISRTDHNTRLFSTEPPETLQIDMLQLRF